MKFYESTSLSVNFPPWFFLQSLPIDWTFMSTFGWTSDDYNFIENVQSQYSVSKLYLKVATTKFSKKKMLEGIKLKSWQGEQTVSTFIMVEIFNL